MRRYEKLIFWVFLIVILIFFWYGMSVAIKNINKKFGKEIRVTESIDSGGRVSIED